MKKSVKYIINESPFYIYFKKHFCPNCKTKLLVKYKSEIINSNSLRAKEYDFSLGDTFMVGDVEFRTKCFYCPKCKKYISFHNVKNAEKQVKTTP